jgi:hypothetical protein
METGNNLDVLVTLEAGTMNQEIIKPITLIDRFSHVINDITTS